jgi:DNA-binding NarL/FixJ family response regulator
MLLKQHRDALSLLWLDDHPLFRRGALDVLRSHWRIEAVECASLEAAQAALESTRFDLAVLDLNLPDGSGQALLPRLKELCIPVLVCSLHGHSTLWRELEEAGALGFHGKEALPEELAKAVQRVLAGKPSWPKESEPVLPSRELEILRHLAHDKSPQAIAKALGITAGTVQTYRKRLLKRFEVQTTAGLVRKATEKGYL